MACDCNSCPFLHKTTALTAAGLLTVTNATNVGNFDKFCLVLTINPNSVVTTAPVAYTVTINGAAVPIVDIWGYPITTDRLCTRKRYSGRYIETAAGNHVTLTNVPCSIADIANAARTTTAEGDGS